MTDRDPIDPDPKNTLAICMLASGSRGNAIYITDGQTAILLDAGLSGIEIERRMRLRGLNPCDLDAIVVSHEHTDHIQGVGILSRRFDLPVYLTPKTRQAAADRLGRLSASRDFRCGADFDINTLNLHAFPISHDACDPAGFTVSQNGKKIGIATDLGIATTVVREHLKGSHLLVLEANHDERMLETGPYPWPLKQRVSGRTGHLSNLAAKNLIVELRHPALEHVVLAHLSQKNNTPQKALADIAPVLPSEITHLTLAHQDTCSPLLYLK